MSIKSVANPSCPKPTIGFPKLMVGAYTNAVVLFHSYGKGTNLSETACHAAGSYSGDWVMTDFTDFEGTLVLSNEP